MWLENLPRTALAAIIIVVAIYNLIGANFKWPLFWNSRQVRRLSLLLPKLVIRVFYSAISLLAIGIAIAVLLGYASS